MNEVTARGMMRPGTKWSCALIFPFLIGWAWVAGGQAAAAQHWLGTPSGMILLTVLITAALTDLAWHKIPNWLTYPAFLWGMGINLVYSLGDKFRGSASELTFLDSLGAVGIQASLLGAVVCFFALLMIFRVAGGGAGDVKLATVIGTFLGTMPGLSSLVWAYFAAGVMILVRMIWIIGPVKFFSMLIRSAGHLLFPLYVQAPGEEEQKQLQQPFRLGPAFLVGTLITVCFGTLLAGQLPW